MDKKPPITEEQDVQKYNEGVASAIDLLVGLGVSYSTSIKKKIEKVNTGPEDEQIRAFSDTLWEAAALLANYRVETFGPVSDEHVDSVSEMFHIGGKGKE